MSTGNFINHKNGIFALHMLSVEDVINSYEDSEDLKDEEILDVIAEELMFETDFFLDNLSENIKNKNLSVIPLNKYKALIQDKDRKLVAEVELKNGYYDGVQVIVETDPEELFSYCDDDEDFADEHSKSTEDLLLAIRELTDELEVAYQFSNGETGYKKIH